MSAITTANLPAEDGLTRSARWLLDHPGDAETVLAQLSPDERDRLRCAMERLQPPQSVQGSLEPRSQAPDWSFLDEIPADDIAALLSDEPPMVHAVVLANLSPNKAAACLDRLDETVASDALLRLARLGEISDTVLSSVQLSLRTKARSGQSRRHAMGKAAAVLSQLPRAKSDSLIRGVSTTDAEAAKSLLKSRFGFEDIHRLSDTSWQALLARIDRDTLAQALWTARVELQQAAERQLTSRGREDLKTRMAALPGSDKTVVREARNRFMETLNQLVATGDVTLPAAKDV